MHLMFFLTREEDLTHRCLLKLPPIPMPSSDGDSVLAQSFKQLGTNSSINERRGEKSREEREESKLQ